MTRARILQDIARDFSALRLECQLGQVESSDQMIEGTDPIIAFVAWAKEQAVEAAIAATEYGTDVPEKYRAAGYVETLVRDFFFEKAVPGMEEQAQWVEDHTDPCYCGAVGGERCSCDDDDDERGL